MSVCSRSSFPPPMPAPTVAAYGVDFVDEDDGRRALSGLGEKIADAAGANSDEHFDKFAAADGEEGDRCLSGDRLADESLAGAWGACQQYPLGYLRAQFGELFGILQEFHNFSKFLLGLCGPGHVIESNVGTVLVDQPGGTLAEAKSLVHSLA